MQNIYEFHDTSSFTNNDLSIKILVWLPEKKKELAKVSRTSTLGWTM